MSEKFNEEFSLVLLDGVSFLYNQVDLFVLINEF